MGAWRPAKWKLFSQPNMAFGCVLLFSAGIARRTAIQPKIFFSQPNGEDQSPRSEMSAANGILLNIRFAYDIAVPAPVWMFEPLGSKSSA